MVLCRTRQSSICYGRRGGYDTGRMKAHRRSGTARAQPALFFEEAAFMPLLEVEHLQKRYIPRAWRKVQVDSLRGVIWGGGGRIRRHHGRERAAKTTLLNILAALDKPTSGAVRLSGGDITKIKDSKMSQFRREHLGFVFQDFNLLDTFSLRDNIFPACARTRATLKWPPALRPSRGSSALKLCWTSTLTKSPAGRNSAQPWPARLSQSRRL